MYLKNLQVIGFKSFCDKTNLDFLPGVTAIVGPNGCGKSNVSDAIRWVLGEQSAKALRGGEMADVIFNGTETRKPLGMAEVSLTFSDCKDLLKTGQLAGSDVNFDEVTVTRRIFKDGNSEYFVNKSPCRLRDVHSIFMDTGVGHTSYSIMEQGKIDRILSARPEDRRSVFEEAAGITKFKSQKKETLRKLEYTEANLVRVSDIIKEVKRQIGSLQRQVGKARRYQALITEIKHLDTQLARHEFEGINSFIQQIDEKTRALKEKSEQLRSKMEEEECGIATLRDQLNAADQQRQGLLQRQRDIQSEIERHEVHIRTNTDRIAETEENIQSSEKQVADARVRLLEFQNLLKSNQENLQNFQKEFTTQNEELEKLQQAFQAADASEKEHGALLHRLQDGLLALEGSLANVRNQILTLEKQQKDLDARNQKLAGNRSLAMDEKQKLSQRLNSLQTEIQSYKHTFTESRHAVTGGEDAVREADRECQILSTRIEEEQRILSKKTSRRDVLSQLQQSFEGYSEGTQALLRQIGENTSDISLPQTQILGTLANLIEVEPEYSIAVEAALSQGLQAIVVSDSPSALQLVEKLKSGDLGRALFAIQSDTTQFCLPSSRPMGLLPGATAWARDVVTSQPSVASFVHRMLADKVIVKDLNTAIELRIQHPELTFVTLDGDVLDCYGILSAGSRKSISVPLITRRNEIITLEVEIKAVETLLHELSTQKGDWEGRRALAQQSLGDRQSELRVQETDLTKKEALLDAIHGEARDIDGRIESTNLEIQEVEKNRAANDAELIRLREELSKTEGEQANAQHELQNARQRSEALALERHRCTVAVHDLRVAHATTQQQIEGLEAKNHSIHSQSNDVSQFIASRDNEIQTGRQRIVQWNGSNAEAKQKISGLEGSREGLAGELKTVEAEKSRLDKEIHTAMDQIRAQRQEVDDVQKEITNCEVSLAEKKGDLEHLSSRIQREYQVDLHTITLMPLDTMREGLPKIRATKSKTSENGEELPEEGEEGVQETAWKDSLGFTNWEGVAARVEEVRAKIQSMGPVNVEAVQEYEELEQRFAFLTREHDDLVLSKDQLLEILKKINTVTKTMFLETFEKIHTNFQTIFVELFGGGKADLRLQDDGDPLECGIEIVAKPPGKQPQSISLLSGGERTMTAVALLFAIYMVKPSPFCVLDEMDAPLDESNINRFIKMLSRFLEHSQFVIITHNKRTIGMADALYGVTMEERGVSKVVSVKFHKRGENGTAVNGQQKDKDKELVEA